MSKATDTIKESIDDVAKKALKEAKKIAENDMFEVKSQIMDALYDHSAKNEDYRTGNFYNAMKLKSQNGTYDCSLSILVNSDSMNRKYGKGSGKYSGMKEGISPDNVLDLLWNQGIRGLPEKGDTPLKESYTYLGHHFEKGEPWENPYWDKYDNEFKLTLKIGNFTSSEGTPQEVVGEFIKNWDYDDAFKKAMDKAVK